MYGIWGAILTIGIDSRDELPDMYQVGLVVWVHAVVAVKSIRSVSLSRLHICWCTASHNLRSI